MRSISYCLFGVFLLASPIARAQEIPCEDGPCVRPRRGGTHFIAEINCGATVAGNGGIDVGGLVGVGGKLRGFPPIFYLVGEFAFGTYGASGTVDGMPLHYSEGSRHRDMALGLRVYIPVHGPFRLFGDLLGGATHASGTLERTGLTALSASGWRPLGVAGLGMQFRLFHHLSLGLRSKFIFTDDGLQSLHDFSGADPVLRTSISAGLTWHF